MTEGRAMEHPAQPLREFAIGHRVGSAEIERTAEILAFESKDDGGHFIGEVNPRHPLLTGAQAAAKSPGKQPSQAFPSVAIKNEPSLQ